MWFLTFSLVAHLILFGIGQAFAQLFTWEPPIYKSTFEQYIDHSNPSLGTFQQRYWYNSEFWGGQGSPIIFINGPEMDAGITASDGELLVCLRTGGQGGYHPGRTYWGESSPYEVLDAEAFQYLTVDQTIADYTRFARTVKLPFDTDASSNSPQAPWVSVGCSYPGMLAAWTSRLDPGTFWAYHAMSAPVQANTEYWEYYDLIRTTMPQNCSQDFVRIAQHVGDTITAGDPVEVAHLKDMFGTGALKDDDFARALVLGLDNWQIEMFSDADTTSVFLSMCDAVEGAVDGVPGSAIPQEGVRLEKALPNFASWFKTDYIANRCRGTVLFSNTDNLTLYEDWLSPNSVACLDWTLNATSPGVVDLSPNSPRDRRYWWLTCNEPTLWTFQVPPPDDRPSLISRTITADYAAGICSRLFPADKGYKYGIANGHTAETVNEHTGGWDYINSTRLMWSNGEFDQWGTKGVSSKFRPGGPPFDSFLSQSVNPGVKAVQEAEIAYVKKWVAEFYEQKDST